MTIRMGLHRHTGAHDGAFKNYVDRVRPQFVKFLDNFPQDLADYCHARGVRVIGRVYFETQKLGAEGSRQMRQVIQTARERPWIDYWELHNEDWQKGPDMDRYAELCIEFMRELDVIGKKAAIGCFSTGQPEVKEWVRFLPALKYAAAHGHAWAVHEYGGGPPGAKWGVGRNQWNDNHPVTDDPCDDPNMRYLGWWCLRYRRAVDEMKRLGMTKIPDLLITEALIDDIQPRPGNVGKGYKDFKGQHPPNVGDYADQWAWYCRELSKDPFVIGAVDFGWATADTDWNSFDVSTDPVTFDRLIQTMTALPNTPPAPQPPPEATMLEGIDVSHWQGKMDWRKAADSGAAFAWIKSSDGSTYIDPEYSRNATGARDAGLLWGPYHYYRNSVDPILQADHLARVVRSGPEPTLPPALDFEDTEGTVSVINMRKFIDRVTATLGRPIIYTGAWWWTPARLGGTQEWAKMFPLWIADYDGAVAVPSDWPTPPGWTVHQYTSSGDGQAFGTDSARIDRNRYRGTRDQLAALRIPPPAPPSGIDVAKLWAQAAANQAIQLNPAAGLQRAILAAGMVPTSAEWDYDEAHVAQRAEALAGGKAAVYVYAKATGRIVRYNQP